MAKKKKKITKKPQPAPNGLSLKRGTANSNASMDASWGIPADAYWDSNPGRWGDYVDEQWTFLASKGMSKEVKQQRGDAQVTGDRVWVRDKGKHSSSTKHYDRSKYHPRTSGRYLSKVEIDIWTGNAKGKTHANTSYSFAKPRKPSISASFDAERGEVAFTITTDAGTDRQERYDTVYWFTRQDSANRGNSYKKETRVKRGDKDRWDGTATELKPAAFDVSDALAIRPGQWIRIRCYAYARGLAGDSETASCEYTIAYPALASITKVGTASVKDGGDVVSVGVRYADKTDAPVTSVKLQRLRDTAIGTAASAAASSGWEDVDGAVDDGNASGFSDQVSAAMPQVRRHTWYRAVTSYGGLVTEGVPVEAKCLYRDRDASGSVEFASLAPGDDGESVTMQLAWSADDFTATQVAWSDHADAWESNDPPDTFTVDWGESTRSAAFTIRGLKEGQRVYVRARRFIDEDVTRYGDWCSPDAALYPVSTSQAPAEVVLDAPSGVERGSGVDCSWTLSAGTQTAWRLDRVDGGSRLTLAEGSGPAGAATIPARLLAGSDAVTVVVSVTTGGDWTDSNARTVAIQERPELSVSCDAELAAQPLALALACTRADCAVLAYVRASRAITHETPRGHDPQARGDVVWAESFVPDWTLDESAGTYGATYPLPAGLALHDGGAYEVTATATDRATGLASDEASAAFEVAWAHQAACPSEDGTDVTPDAATLTAAITPMAPEGAASTDVCDVYRVTMDGAALIAEDVPFGTTVTDPYAPYAADAELAYRLCTRTADGDLSWSDWEYELPFGALRIDWDGKHVELPYDIRANSGWQKSFGLSERWDGSRAGRWDEGATRKGSLSTDLLRVESQEEARLVRELARYAGACYVRIPDGSAFCADVQVKDYDVSDDSALAAVALDATEIDMTGEFMVDADGWSAPGEGE